MYANAQRWVFRAALNDSNESLEVTETGNAFQTVAAACTKVQSPATAPIVTVDNGCTSRWSHLTDCVCHSIGVLCCQQSIL